MGSPVVHFEIHAKDKGETQKFYEQLFDWKVDNNNPMNYGMVDTGANGTGVNGGIMSESQSGNMITFYVQVPDPQQALDKAKGLGAHEVMGVTEMGPVTMAMFTDPAGNVVGVVKG
ncbi:MAG TPA: VOC family protein [Candidatus Dormibacteraeota bacterium]|jgi:predicted enzyme related to lactoylglutathione lyase|nr:VOC family protein [Candidatus Dormibacteraeota bacterium]